MSGVIEPHVGGGDGQPQRERIPQRLFRPADPKPTKAQMIEADPVLRGLRDHGNLDNADLEWIAATGRAYIGKRLPWFVEQREPGRCLDAAEWLASSWGYAMVMGFAIHPEVMRPLPHAWGGVGRSAIDPSWRDPTQCAYFGIAGDDARNTKRLLRIGNALHDHYGLIPTKRSLWAGVEV